MILIINNLSACQGWTVSGTLFEIDKIKHIVNRTDKALTDDEKVDMVMEMVDVSITGPNILDGKLDRVSAFVVMKAIEHLLELQWPTVSVVEIDDVENGDGVVEYMVAIGQTDAVVHAAIRSFSSMR